MSAPPVHQRQAQAAERRAIRQFHLYFIQEGEAGPIKIGVSEFPNVRAGELQTGNPRPLHVIRTLPAGHTGAATALERRWHTAFGSQRMVGEWFAPSPELLAAISLGCP